MTDFDSSILVPEWIMGILYNGKVIPNGEEHKMKVHGANCQVYAYQFLRYNGYFVPDYRSKELWEDEKYSHTVESFQPLDILFFNKTDETWWAHVWIYIWDNKIIHNSFDIGKPAIWNFDEFEKNDKYKVFIGAKRFCKTSE